MAENIKKIDSKPPGRGTPRSLLTQVKQQKGRKRGGEIFLRN